jgi:nitrate/TMAO reductase-like tetraheme cytochrome c subunit
MKIRGPKRMFGTVIPDRELCTSATNPQEKAMKCPVLLALGLFQMSLSVSAQDLPAGGAALGSKEYDQYEKPKVCQSCHTDFYQQWTQAMMSQAYTHHWDEIEYFKLAVPHAEKDEVVAEVKAGCNGCHAPVSFLAGDVPPPRPEENSRANESVSCDVCHTITGFEGDIPYNFNYISDPGRTKYGPKPGLESPHHDTEYLEFIPKPEFCGTCHNEMSPYGVWVKSTHIEWSEGPYAEEGVRCHQCHMPAARGKSAKMAREDLIAQHLFHGAHDPGKLAGAVELRMHPEEREVEIGELAVLKVQLFNAKAGHKIPTGSVEDRIVWLHVTATDEDGNVYHLPVEPKGFAGEEYTIAADVLAYQDMGLPLDLADFKGLPRDGIPYGNRIFRMPYFDPQGRMTIMQWNTKSLGVDYRLAPRETKVETFVWEIPDEAAVGRVTVEAVLNYQKLVAPVADFLEVPADEKEIVVINRASTWIEIYD